MTLDFPAGYFKNTTGRKRCRDSNLDTPQKLSKDGGQFSSHLRHWSQDQDQQQEQNPMGRPGLPPATEFLSQDQADTPLRALDLPANAHSYVSHVQQSLAARETEPLFTLANASLYYGSQAAEMPPLGVARNEIPTVPGANSRNSLERGVQERGVQETARIPDNHWEEQAPEMVSSGRRDTYPAMLETAGTRAVQGIEEATAPRLSACTFSNAPYRRLGDIFPNMMCSMIKKIDGDKVAVAMSIPYPESGPFYYLMEVSIVPEQIRRIAWLLFGVHISSENAEQYIHMAEGLKILAPSSLQGASMTGMEVLLGQPLLTMVAECPLESMLGGRSQNVTLRIPRHIEDDGVLSLNLGFKAGQALQQQLYSTNPYGCGNHVPDHW